jgi:pectin methylesterase-like acyl-CoA thioesterase
MLAVGSAGAQTTFYVRTGGSDSSDGLAAETAFRTVQKAVRSCGSTAGGYTIYVGPGTYLETVEIDSAAGR